MKTLFLLRHASAGDDPIGGSDHDRQLSPRGAQEALRVAEHLAESFPVQPSLSLCSSARRARETLDPIEKRLAGENETILLRELYLAGAQQLLTSIAETEDRHGSVLVVAHNPGISELANELCRGGDEAGESPIRRGFPPAALAVFTLDLESWSTVRPKHASLVAFVRPADLD